MSMKSLKYLVGFLFLTMPLLGAANGDYQAGTVAIVGTWAEVTNP